MKLTMLTVAMGFARSTFRARLCKIEPVRISDLPVPDSARQGHLQLEDHEEIPEAPADAEVASVEE